MEQTSWEQQTASGQRFCFGDNWLRFLAQLNDSSLQQAEASLRTRLRCDSLAGSCLLDAGCGSGLFSLAARRLGARVYSFDFDPQSVACTQELKRRYAPDDPEWVIQRGSLLDAEFLQALAIPQGFDVVYSWGVLHHTGAMWQALGNLLPLVKADGLLFIALYNDQGALSRAWKLFKQAYCKTPAALQPLLSVPTFCAMWAARILLDGVQGHPLRRLHACCKNERGMTLWRDHIDWIGGYPFEVARVDQVHTYLRDQGFSLQDLHCVGIGLGCNEFLFKKNAVNAKGKA